MLWAVSLILLEYPVSYIALHSIIFILLVSVYSGPWGVYQRFAVLCENSHICELVRLKLT